jgi:hypothetical protein
MQTAIYPKTGHPSCNKKAPMSVFAHQACRLLHHYASPKGPRTIPPKLEPYSALGSGAFNIRSASIRCKTVIGARSADILEGTKTAGHSVLFTGEI